MGTVIAMLVFRRKRRRGKRAFRGEWDSVIARVVAALLLSSCREVLLSHANLEIHVAAIELENEHDELFTIFGVLDQLSAIDLDTERDALLPIFVELAVRREILCEIDALSIDELKHVVDKTVGDDVGDGLQIILSKTRVLVTAHFAELLKRQMIKTLLLPNSLSARSLP